MPMMHAVPQALSTEVIQAIDRRAVEELGLSSAVLMENAGRGAAEGLLARAPEAVRRAGPSRPVVVLCGPGNNGGDGHVIARHLSIAGVPTVSWSVRQPAQLAPDARTNARANQALGLRQRWLDGFRGGALAMEAAEELASAPVVVDALLGTGQHGELREPFASLVAFANASRAVRVAVDVPTGVEADSGAVGSVAFRAAWTATFVAPKLGFEHARSTVGEVAVFSIGVPASFVERVRREVEARSGA